MAWGKADDYLDSVFSESENLEKIAKQKKLISESRLNVDLLKEFFDTVNSFLMPVDDYFLENRLTRGISLKNFISVGVGPYGDLGVIYDGYVHDGDTLFIPLNSREVLYYSELLFGDNKSHVVYNAPITLDTLVESLFSGGRGMFKNRAFTVHDGLVDIYSNGLESNVIYTFSIKTGKLVEGE